MDEPSHEISLCECGCGTPTKIATETDTRSGVIVGMPRRFARGHTANRRGQIVTPGERFGRGVVLDADLRRRLPSGGLHRMARLLCDCGTEYVTLINTLITGDSQSCGCLNRERRTGTSAPGMSTHPHYKRWDAMLARCEDPGSISYKNYGARGISVCKRWHDVRLFVEDIDRLLGPCPKGWSLDRIDNDGNYEPDNVRWASPKMQIANRRPFRNVGNRDTDPLSAGLANWWQQREYRTETCERCGDEFQTRAVTPPRFCSKRCAAAARYASGKYDTERTCHLCGASFITNRHRKTRHCSDSCAATCRHAGGCPPD